MHDNYKDYEVPLGELRSLLKVHKSKEMSLMKNAINMTLKEVQITKKDISEISKKIETLIKKVEGLGFVWERHVERKNA